MNILLKIMVLTYFLTMSVSANSAGKKQELIDFYGKLNISIQATTEKNESFNEMKSNASRVGVKGKYQLDHGLTAIYHLEWQVNVNDSSKDSLTARNQWIGLQGDFGELTLGRSDTTLKMSQGKFDLFNDYEGDLKHLFIGENRVSDTITYKSPFFNRLQLLASYIISDDHSADDPYSIGFFYGDMNLKKENFFVSIAHDEKMPTSFKKYDGSKSTEALANTRLTGMYKIDKLRLGAMYVDSEVGSTGKAETGFAVNASYVVGNVLAKIEFQEFAGANSLSVGADYKVGKNTKLYTWFTNREENNYLADDGFTYVLSSKGKYFALGMEQKF